MRRTGQRQGAGSTEQDARKCLFRRLASACSDTTVRYSSREDCKTSQPLATKAAASLAREDESAHSGVDGIITALATITSR